MKMNKKGNGKLPMWAKITILVTSLIYIIFIILFAYFVYITEIDSDISKDLVIMNDNSLETKVFNDSYVISGKLTNSSDSVYYDVEIIYNLYDKEGNLIGEASDEINRLGVSETWKFSASYYGVDCNEVYTYTILEIDGDKEL